MREFCSDIWRPFYRGLWHCAVFRGGGKFLCRSFTSEERDSPIRGLALSEVAEFWFVVRFTVVAASGYALGYVLGFEGLAYCVAWLSVFPRVS